MQTWMNTFSYSVPSTPARRYIHTFIMHAYSIWDTPPSAPNSAPNSVHENIHTYTWYMHVYMHACIHTYIVLPVLPARRYIHMYIHNTCLFNLRHICIGVLSAFCRRSIGALSARYLRARRPIDCAPKPPYERDMSHNTRAWNGYFGFDTHLMGYHISSIALCIRYSN